MHSGPTLRRPGALVPLPQDCAFAPFFPADQPQRFSHVRRVFGVANTTRLLLDVPLEQREDTANSLIYEAQARVNEPIYGSRVAGSLARASFVAGPNGNVTHRLQHCTTVTRAAGDHQESFASIGLILHSKQHKCCEDIRRLQHSSASTSYTVMGPFLDQLKQVSATVLFRTQIGSSNKRRHQQGFADSFGVVHLARTRRPLIVNTTGMCTSGWSCRLLILMVKASQAQPSQPSPDQPSPAQPSQQLDQVTVGAGTLPAYGCLSMWHSTMPH
eukprot:SM000038S14312  [mRNA]  locus=s38:101641:104553:- [translate_table: standard]